MYGFTVGSLQCAEERVACDGSCTLARHSQVVVIQSDALGFGYPDGQTPPEATVAEMHAARMTARGVLALVAVRILHQHPHWSISFSSPLHEEDDWEGGPLIEFCIPAGHTEDKPRKALTDALSAVQSFLCLPVPQDVSEAESVAEVVARDRALGETWKQARALASMLGPAADPWLTYVGGLTLNERRAELDRMRAEVAHLVVEQARAESPIDQTRRTA